MFQIVFLRLNRINGFEKFITLFRTNLTDSSQKKKIPAIKRFCFFYGWLREQKYYKNDTKIN